MRFERRRWSGLSITLAVLVYLLVASSVTASAFDPTDTSLYVMAGAALLVAACAWLLDAARRAGDERKRMRLRLLAAGVVLALVPMLVLPGAQWVALAAIVLCFAMLTWTWSRLVAVVPVFVFLLMQEPYIYFGALLITIGLALRPGRLGDYLRDLFPRPVGGAR